MRFKKKPKADLSPRILRMPRLEWTKHDQAIAKTFFSSDTFNRVKAYCDGILVNLIVKGDADDSYRKGWIDCQRQYAAFANVEDTLNDSEEITSMQGDED